LLGNKKCEDIHIDHGMMRKVIIQFIEDSSGLNLLLDDVDKSTFVIKQVLDSKIINIDSSCIIKVLERVDESDNPFLQINFKNDKKLLLTEKLVGFKPLRRVGLDMSKIPNIVTTPDLMNVIEAIEDSLDDKSEIEVLKLLFHSVLDGAENIGFSLSRERTWVAHLNSKQIKASA